jgi:hypothetical protein
LRHLRFHLERLRGHRIDGRVTPASTSQASSAGSSPGPATAPQKTFVAASGGDSFTVPQ